MKQKRSNMPSGAQRLPSTYPPEYHFCAAQSTSKYTTYLQITNIAIYTPPNCCTSALPFRAPFPHLFPYFGSGAEEAGEALLDWAMSITTARGNETNRYSAEPLRGLYEVKCKSDATRLAPKHMKQSLFPDDEARAYFENACTVLVEGYATLGPWLAASSTMTGPTLRVSWCGRMRLRLYKLRLIPRCQADHAPRGHHAVHTPEQELLGYLQTFLGQKSQSIERGVPPDNEVHEEHCRQHVDYAACFRYRREMLDFARIAIQDAISMQRLKRLNILINLLVLPGMVLRGGERAPEARKQCRSAAHCQVPRRRAF